MHAKYIIIKLLFLLFFNNSIGQNLKTYQDSVSYAAGVSAANDLLNRGGKQIDSKIFVEAFKSYFDNKEIMLTPEVAQAMFSNYIAESWQKENTFFLEGNKKRPEVKTLPSGLQYEIIAEGLGETRPHLESNVIVHYEGALIYGKIFDSTIQRGQPIQLNLDNVIEGWAEGLQLMRIKDKFRLFIPAELAYGSDGAGNVIPPFSTLIFDVELLDIE